MSYVPCPMFYVSALINTIAACERKEMVFKNILEDSIKNKGSYLTAIIRTEKKPREQDDPSDRSNQVIAIYG